MPRRQVALVAGATGIVGYRLARLLTETKGWEVIGISRKPPLTGARFKFVSADLTNADDCRDKLASLPPITHLFYAAKYTPPDHLAPPEGAAIDINLSMLKNLVQVLDKRAGSLKHVHLVHGNSYYGGSFRKTPSREDDPRCLNNNFYYVQQDFITKRQKGKRWTWSISRPQGVCDHLPHIARSIPLGIAVYAAISKARGLSLCFPGCAESYGVIQQCTEAFHLAKAIVWIASSPQCANEAFNVTNGDYFRWKNVWPKIADFFAMPVGSRREAKLAKAMKDQVPNWNALVAAHKLRRMSCDELVLWPYVDRVFSARCDQMSNVTKLHKFGFHDIVDTEDMFLRFFNLYQRARTIP